MSKDQKDFVKVPKVNKPEQVTPAVIKQAEKDPEFLPQRIYVGPNFAELQKYTVAKDGLTPHMEDVIKKCPSVGKLFVKIEDMAYVEGRVNEKGTLEHRHFNKIFEYANGKDE